MSFQTEELRILLRTIAETRGADQMRNSLGQVRQSAATTSQGLTGLSQSTRNSAASMGQFALAAAGVGGATVLASVAVHAFASGIAASVNAAAEAVRQQRTLAATYGSNTEQINRLATALRAVGVAQSDVSTSAITTDTLIKNYGLTIQQVQTLITRTNDLAVAQGRDLPDSVKRVSDAIRGEAEASEALGLTLNREFLAEQRRKSGLQGTFDQLSQNTRAQITFNEFLRQSEQFSGQAAKATGELDGSMRQLDTAIKELSVSFGELFGPAVTQGNNRLTGVARGLDGLLDRLKSIGKVMEDPKIQVALGIASALGAGGTAGRLGQVVVGPGSFRPTGAALSSVELDASRQPSAADRTAFEANARVERERAARESRRLLSLNENLPAQSAERSLAEISFLDQRDAAIRDLIQSQQELNTLQREAIQLSAQEAEIRLRMLPAERALADLQRQQTERQIAAKLSALPANEALEDTNAALQRARLVLADRRNQSPEDRLAARRTIRDATRNVLPGQELAAFDANQGVRAADRSGTRLDLQVQLQQIANARALDSVTQQQETNQLLLSINNATQQTAQQRLDETIAKAIKEGIASMKELPMHVTVNVTAPDGSVQVFDQLIEANGAANTPPVIQLSGAR